MNKIRADAVESHRRYYQLDLSFGQVPRLDQCRWHAVPLPHQGLVRPSAIQRPQGALVFLSASIGRIMLNWWLDRPLTGQGCACSGASAGPRGAHGGQGPLSADVGPAGPVCGQEQHQHQARGRGRPCAVELERRQVRCGPRPRDPDIQLGPLPVSPDSAMQRLIANFPRFLFFKNMDRLHTMTSRSRYHDVRFAELEDGTELLLVACEDGKTRVYDQLASEAVSDDGEEEGKESEPRCIAELGGHANR